MTSGLCFKEWYRIAGRRHTNPDRHALCRGASAEKCRPDPDLTSFRAVWRQICQEDGAEGGQYGRFKMCGGKLYLQ